MAPAELRSNRIARVRPRAAEALTAFAYFGTAGFCPFMTWWLVGGRGPGGVFALAGAIAAAWVGAASLRRPRHRDGVVRATEDRITAEAGPLRWSAPRDRVTEVRVEPVPRGAAVELHARSGAALRFEASSLDAAARTRVRVAADACADEALRDALRGALDGAVDDATAARLRRAEG